MSAPEHEAPWRRIAARILTFGFIAAFFLYFAWDGTRAHWAADDPMNLYMYWRQPFWRILLATFAWFLKSYRPFGGVFYLSLYHFWALNPAPYRLALIAVLGINVALAYRVTRLLGAMHRVAALAALAVSIHASMSDLLYSTSSLYDVFCFTFTFLVLMAYLHPRSQECAVTPKQIAVVLCCYILAMSSKEMAYSIPFLLIAYELIYHPPARLTWPDVREWLRTSAVVPAITALMALAALPAKFLGAGALASMDAYRPRISLRRWIESNVSFTNDMFCQADFWTNTSAPLLWLAMAYLAWRKPRPILRFAFAFVFLSGIPIWFLPQRHGGTLYIPLFGWALFAAVLAGDLIRFAAREPLFTRLPRWIPEAVFTCLLVYGFFRWTSYTIEGAPDGFRKAQAQTWEVISAFDKSGFRPKPGSKVLFLKDPFVDAWDLYFIAALEWNDHRSSIDILHRLPDPKAVNFANYDYVLSFGEHGELVQAGDSPKSLVTQ